MKAVTRSVLAVSAVGTLGAALLPSVAVAADYAGTPDARDRVAQRDSKYRSDNLPNPIADKQNALRDRALQLVLNGKREVQRVPGGSDVVRVFGNQYAEVNRQASDTDPDQILTFLIDFGNKHKEGTPQGIPGPVHNNIPKPDRNWDGSATDDNSTYWVPRFSRGHYLELLFGNKMSMANFYKKQSRGEYAIDGDVSGWFKVPYRESRYGYNKDQADGYWNFVKDSARSWYRDKVAKGWSEERIRTYLKRFDQWDRYDQDADGNFQESDGYIDHFQAIHAGEGEEAGAPSWAIWSHRWYAFPTLYGSAGPPGYYPQGGVPIGKSGIWIGDYTTEPENGGLGIFAHEYGHDLGLMDYYDTAGGDNGTGFWTLMSAGSWLNKGGKAIGTKPNYMGPHEKFLLGWLKYRYLPYAPGTTRTPRLGLAEAREHGPQALIVGLPEARKTVHYNEPHSGNWEWWGGSADNLNATLTHQFNLTDAQSAKLTSWAWYDLEEGYDFLYAEVSNDGGATWQNVYEANHPDTGIDGSSVEWVKLRYDLTNWAGEQILFRFRYQTDQYIHYAGPFLDDIKLTEDGTVTYSTSVEDPDGDGWVADGTWKRSTGTETETGPHYYLVENRRYVGYDETLRTGPYNFGWAYTRPNWVERFPYQDGMLVWYWNTLYEDNNTSVHPGHGLALPVDSFLEPIQFADGSNLGNRRQTFDATFGTAVTDRVIFHRQVMEEDGDVRTMRTAVPVRHQKSVFDDSEKKRYWSAENPWNSVKVGGTDTRIKVLFENRNGWFMDLRVTQAGDPAVRQ